MCRDNTGTLMKGQRPESEPRIGRSGLVWLLIIVLPCVLFAYPCWASGMVFALGVLWRHYADKIRHLANKENAAHAVSLSVVGSNLHWQPKNDSKSKEFDSDLIWPSLAGIGFALVIGHVWYQRQSSPGTFSFMAIIVSAAVIPPTLLWLRPRNFYERWLIKRLIPVIGEQDLEIEGMEELLAFEIYIERMLDELKIENKTSKRVARGVEQYVAEHQVELLFDRAPLSQLVAKGRQTALEILSELQERSRKFKGAGANSSESGPAPSRMTKDMAFRILGLSNGATFSDVQAARKEAIKKFNVDHRQDLEPHIRDLVEEKFKQVNMAYDFLKAAF